MVKRTDAIEQVRSVARMFQSVIDLAESLGEITSLEQAKGELAAQLAQLRGEVEVARAEVQEAQALATQQSARAVNVVAEAESKAAAITAEAETRIQLARVAADVAAEAFQIETAKQRDAIRQEARAAEQARDTAAQELSDITAKIDRARSKMAELLRS